MLGPHSAFILAAYAIAAIILGAMIIQSIAKLAGAKRRLAAAERALAGFDSAALDSQRENGPPLP